MNTVQLAQIVSRHLDVTDLSALESDKALELVDAINFGIQTFFSLAPNSYSRTTLSHTVQTPDTANLSLTKGSNATDTASFLRTQRGSSVIIEGDAKINEITGETTLLHDYSGPTGIHTAKIYYDAVPVTDFLILELVTEPKIVETGKTIRQMSDGNHRNTVDPRYESETDYPEYYTLEYVGGSLDADIDAVFQLRFVPRPVVTCSIKFDAHILPVAYEIPVLTTPATVPVPHSLVSRLLVPLIEGRLSDSTLWGDTGDKNVAQARAAAAEQRIQQLPAYYARRRGVVKTRYGW